LKDVRSRNRRAFTILEMMIALSLLAVFSVVAVRVTNLCMRLPQKSAASQSGVERFDVAFSVLRQDVWAAQSLRCPDEQTLEISAGGPAVVWHMGTDASLSRSVAQSGRPGASIRRWQCDQRIQFSAAGPTVLVTAVQDSQATRAELVSQFLLAGGDK
jgi:prepilin-type N-terminal cleavage/methylation domain-containing protein